MLHCAVARAHNRLYCTGKDQVHVNQIEESVRCTATARPGVSGAVGSLALDGNANLKPLEGGGGAFLAAVAAGEDGGGVFAALRQDPCVAACREWEEAWCCVGGGVAAAQGTGTDTLQAQVC